VTGFLVTQLRSASAHSRFRTCASRSVSDPKVPDSLEHRAPGTEDDRRDYKLVLVYDARIGKL
jgi:hypothetical protein